jgi:hypothetical protein
MLPERTEAEITKIKLIAILTAGINFLISLYL